MRIVLDTNVYLSNFIFGGLTSKVCSLCFEEHSVFVSKFIKNEIVEKLAGKFAYPPDQIEFVLKTIDLVTIEIVPTNLIPTVCRDSDDNEVLQLCQFVKADFLVTGDKDLLVLIEFEGTRIVSPRQLVESL